MSWALDEVAGSFPGFGVLTIYACNISGGNDAEDIAVE